jgi:NitT/TauT family transport system substrate-binding protein
MRTLAAAVGLMFCSSLGANPGTFEQQARRVFRKVSLASAGRSEARKPLTIGLGPWIGFGPFYLAREKGFFKEAGVDVDLVVLTGLAERNSALRAGHIDALAAPVDYFVFGAGNGLPSLIVAAVDESSGGDGIVAKNEIRRVEDLRGRKIAFQRGLPGEFFLRSLLDNCGISMDEVQGFDMETANAGAAFLAGRVDAAVVWEPWLSKASEGGGRVLASTRDFPGLIVDVLAFNPDSARRRPADVRRVVSALLRAVEYWKTNPDEANKIMAPRFQVSPEKFAAILSGARFMDLHGNRAFFGSGGKESPVRVVVDRAVKVWGQAGILRTPFDPGSLATSMFLPGDDTKE